MSKFRRYSLGEASREAGVEHHYVVHCLRAHWVQPAYPEESLLDELDLARLRLIASLQVDFGVNDEAVPVILHLVDQLQGDARAGSRAETTSEATSEEESD